MTIYLILTIVFLAYVAYEYFAIQPKTGRNNASLNHAMDERVIRRSFFVLLLLGLALRLYLAYATTGYEADLACFRSWSQRVHELGFGNFYDPTGQYFADYPPGYYYVLYLLGALAQHFHIDLASSGGILLLKLPAIVSDLLMALVLFRLALTRKNGRAAALLPALILLNPAVILDSAVWGQIDSVFTLLVLLCVIKLCEGKNGIATIWYAFALLVKPQALLLAPVMLLSVAWADEPVRIPFLAFRPQKGWSVRIWNLLLCLGGGFLLFWLGCLPFWNVDLLYIIGEKYFGTMGYYNYATVNASNLYALLGGNFEQSAFFALLNGVFLTLILAFVLLLFLRGKGKNRPAFAAFFSILMMYLLLTKMHERYLYPAIALGFLWYILSKDRRALLWTTIISACQYVLMGRVLYYLPTSSKVPDDAWFFVPSAILLVLGVFVGLYAYRYFIKNESLPLENESRFELSADQRRSERSARSFRLPQPTPHLSFRRADALILAILLLGYGILSFTALGDHAAPETYYLAQTPGDSFTIDLGRDVSIASINFYSGLYLGEYGLEITSEDGTLTDLILEQKSVFCTHALDVGATGRYLKVTAQDAPLMLMEMAVYEQGSDVPLPVQVISGMRDGEHAPQNLFDEQELVAKTPNYTNGTYFDEIYHARTGYEFLHGFEPYETTHPPLGKVLIAGSIALFGMNPFGWRFLGALFGVLGLLVIYLFAKRIFSSTSVATGAALLFAFDFMHFTQSRIGTVDAFTVVFVLVSFYFMYEFYISCLLQKRMRAMLWPLFFSGLFFAFAAATKWNCLYAGVGLLGVFLLALFRLYQRVDRAVFLKKLWVILGSCVGFFILVPLAVYLLSYIPFWKASSSSGGFFETVWKNQLDMFRYHSQLTDTHPYQSEWYKWVADIRPIWYSYNELSNDKFSSISAFGNPLIWWVGIAAILVMAVVAVRRKYDVAWILLLAYFSQLVPWMFVTRPTFIYHYYNLTPFLILMICACIYGLRGRRMWPVYSYVAACGVLFVLFYPVLSGMAVEKWYLRFLTWLPSWTFYIG